MPPRKNYEGEIKKRYYDLHDIAELLSSDADSVVKLLARHKIKTIARNGIRTITLTQLNLLRGFKQF